MNRQSNNRRIPPPRSSARTVAATATAMRMGGLLGIGALTEISTRNAPFAVEFRAKPLLRRREVKLAVRTASGLRINIARGLDVVRDEAGVVVRSPRCVLAKASGDRQAPHDPTRCDGFAAHQRRQLIVPLQNLRSDVYRSVHYLRFIDRSRMYSMIQ